MAPSNQSEVQLAARELQPAVHVHDQARPALRHDEVGRGAEGLLPVDVGKKRAELERDAGPGASVLQDSRHEDHLGQDVGIEQLIAGLAAGTVEGDEVLKVHHQLPARQKPQVENGGGRDEIVDVALRVPVHGAELELEVAELGHVGVGPVEGAIGPRIPGEAHDGQGEREDEARRVGWRACSPPRPRRGLA